MRHQTAALPGAFLAFFVVAAIVTTSAAAQEVSFEQIARAMMQGQEPTRDQLQQLIEQGDVLNGPVIQDFGHTVPVADRDMPVAADHRYKVYFDALMPAALPEFLGGTHQIIDSAARFLNMHVAAGVPPENLDLAVVIYGLSTEAALGNEEYRARYGKDNPNVPLMEALAEAGVDIYVCGQTSAMYGVTMENKAAPVKMALSAMTMFAELQADGYVKVH